MSTLQLAIELLKFVVCCRVNVWWIFWIIGLRPQEGCPRNETHSSREYLPLIYPIKKVLMVSSLRLKHKGLERGCLLYHCLRSSMETIIKSKLEWRAEFKILRCLSPEKRSSAPVIWVEGTVCHEGCYIETIVCIKIQGTIYVKLLFLCNGYNTKLYCCISAPKCRNQPSHNSFRPDKSRTDPILATVRTGRKWRASILGPGRRLRCSDKRNCCENWV